jgi:hypothetical protein
VTRVTRRLEDEGETLRRSPIIGPVRGMREIHARAA